MTTIVNAAASTATATSHNTTAATGIKSRLPLARLAQVCAMNTRAGQLRYADGFGDMAPPDRRPKAPVVSMFRRRASDRSPWRR